VKVLLLAIALVLSACDAIVSDMPNLQDPEAVKAAIVELDPIAPGSTSKSTGEYGTGQPGSDRNLFYNWLRRFDSLESTRRMNIDYKPSPLPRTIAAAIEEERKSEAGEQAQLQASRREAELIEADRRARNHAATAAIEKAAAERQQAIEAATEVYEARNAEIEVAFAECDRQREAAQATKPITDGYATYRSFECDRKRDDARGAALAERSRSYQ
jgi:hypothetical protein